MYDLEPAEKSTTAIEGFSGGNTAIGVPRIPFKCPAAPYETALLLDHHFKEKKGLGDKTKIRFFTPEGLPLPSAGPEIGNSALEFMKSRGIVSNFKVKLTEVRPGEAIYDDGSMIIPFDLLFAVPPHVCPKPVAEAGLVDQTGWIPVDPATMQTRLDNVYAIGDNTSVPTPSGFVPFLPKAGVFAHGRAEAVAHNIAVEIKGRGARKMYDGGGACFLMTGGARAAFVKGNWYSKPHPEISYHEPRRTFYMQRAPFEKYRMHHWF